MTATYTVLHRDDALLVVDKAAGVLTVGYPGSKERCLLDDLRRDGLPVAPVHRLDRETSGVLLLCLDKSRRAELEALFRDHDVIKEYLALVRGVPQSRRATIDVPILDEGATARVNRRGRRAVTRYEVLETLSGRSGATGRSELASLLRIRLDTGRHNQIRVHCAHIGNPLLGDRKYGRGTDGPARCMLHAERLSLRHPATGRTLNLRAPLPADFEATLAALRVSGRGPGAAGRPRS